MTNHSCGSIPSSTHTSYAGKKLCGMNIFSVRATLEPVTDIIGNFSVFEFKPILSAEYCLMSNVGRICAPSSLHVSGLQVVNKEEVAFSGHKCYLSMGREHLH